MQDHFDNFIDEANAIDEVEALTAAMAEAEDLLAEFAIETRAQAKESLLRAVHLADESAEQEHHELPV